MNILFNVLGYIWIIASAFMVYTFGWKLAIAINFFIFAALMGMTLVSGLLIVIGNWCYNKATGSSIL